MKKLMILLTIILIMSVFVKAEIIPTCKVAVSISEATENVIVKVPVMENKTITKNVSSLSVYKISLTNYYDTLRNYTKQQSQIKAGVKIDAKNIIQKPVRPLPTLNIIQINKTIQVQKIEPKTEYYIDFLGLKILPHTVQVKVYADKTKNQLKNGYELNKDDGKIYATKKGEDCT